MVTIQLAGIAKLGSAYAPTFPTVNEVAVTVWTPSVAVMLAPPNGWFVVAELITPVIEPTFALRVVFTFDLDADGPRVTVVTWVPKPAAETWTR